jgi:hypothetical protein
MRFFVKSRNQLNKIMPKGTPKRDGSGRGVRANRGRGGCATTRRRGRNKK